MMRDPSPRVSHAMESECVFMLGAGTMRAELVPRKFDSLRTRSSHG